MAKHGKFFRKENMVYFLSFGLPILMMLGIFIFQGIFPFGKNSFMYSDMYHQYVPFLTEFWEKVHRGESLAYTFRIGLGTNFTAIYAYYLASPVYWLSLLVPKAYLADFMTYMIVLKIGLCGFTFSYYLCKHFQSKDLRFVWFALFYAMSGYIAAYNWNHMWMDCIVLAPIVILGLEELILSGKCKRYILFLAACIFTNYYLSILFCIFLVLYFLMVLFTNGLSFRQKAKAFFRFSVSSLLAGGMTGVLLIPVMYAMQATGFHDFSFPRSIEVYFNLLEMLARHVPMLQTERGLDHWPNIYCGVLVFILIPMYIFHKNITVRQKAGHLILLSVFLLSFSVNILNYIWHGFNYPNSLPARQSFLYIFVILTMGCEVVYRQKENGKVQTVLGVVSGCLLLAACGIFVTTDGLTVQVMASAWIFLAGYFILKVVFAVIYGKKGWQRIENWAILLLVCAECVLNMTYTSVDTISRNFYLNRQKEYESMTALIQEREPEQVFYRMDNLDQMTKNDGALAGFCSLSVFSSTTNRTIRNIYDKMGMGGSKVSYYHRGATPFAESLFSMKYLLTDQYEPDTELYKKIGETENFYLYENRYALPIGFYADTALKESWDRILTQSNSSALSIQKTMVHALNVDEELFSFLNDEIIEEAEDSITVSVKGAGYLYGLVSSEPEGKVFLACGEEEQELKNVSDENLLRIGYFEAGDTFTIHSEEGEQIWIRIYRLQEQAYEQAMNRLLQYGFAAREVSAGNITGTVEAPSDGYVIFTVPAEKGWCVSVDGENTDYDLFAQGLIAVPVSRGEHEIRMQYKVPGLALGAGVSLTAFLLFVLIYGRNSRKERKK